MVKKKPSKIKISVIECRQKPYINSYMHYVDTPTYKYTDLNFDFEIF